MSDLKAKMHQNRFRLGSAPDFAGGAHSATPDPQLDLRCSTSKGKRGVQGRGGVKVDKGKKGGKGREGARGRKEKGREGRGRNERGGDTRHTNPSLLPAPLV